MKAKWSAAVLVSRYQYDRADTASFAQLWWVKDLPERSGAIAVHQTYPSRAYLRNINPRSAFTKYASLLEVHFPCTLFSQS